MSGKITRRAVFAMLAGAGLIYAGSGNVFAMDRGAAGIHVTDAWARPSIGNAPNGAAYFNMSNHSKKDDVLIAVKTSVSGKAELHTHIHEGNIMRMRRLENGAALPAGATLKFSPGGHHVMLLGLNRPLKDSDVFSLILVFQESGEVPVEVTVRKPGASSSPAHKKKMEHKSEHKKH